MSESSNALRRQSAADKAVAEMKRANTLLRKAQLAHNRIGLKAEQAYGKIVDENQMELEAARIADQRLGRMKKLLPVHKRELEFARQTMARIRLEAETAREVIMQPSLDRLTKASERHRKAAETLNALIEPD